MKTLSKYFSVALLMVSMSVFAQYKITGTIKDSQTNANLKGVSINLPDLKRGVVSDQNGNYTISDIKSGDYLIKADLDGYKASTFHLELNKDTIVNFSLEPSATEIEEIVVTGVNHSTELKRTPVVIKAINQDTFNQESSTNLIDALKSIPGVSDISTGPAVSKPIIRGLGYNRVITLNNGVKQEGQQWGDEHGIEIDEYSVDRVEIIKGPGSLMYGSDGIAGVLNFLPPRPPHEGEINTRVVNNYQSNNQMFGYSLSNSGNKNGFQWLGRLSNKSAGNYENKYDGKVFNSGFKEWDGDLSLGLNKNWGHSILTVSSYNNKLGIVEGERDGNGKFIYEDTKGKIMTATPDDLSGNKIWVPYQKINHLRVASNNYIILNRGSINADFGFQNNRRREFEEAEDPNAVGLYLALNTFNYNVRYNFHKKNNWETSVGITGLVQSNHNRGNEFLIPDYNMWDVGGFVYTQKSFDRFTLAGGFRMDNRRMDVKGLYLNENEEPTTPDDENSEVKFSPFKNNYNGFSGSIGLSYQLNHQSTLKLNLSRGFRAPNIAELASNGKHEGTFRYEIGNPDLKSESSQQIDLAYFLNSDHITLEISPFVNFIHNYSFLEKLADEKGNEILMEDEDGGTVPAFGYQSGNAMLYGGEFYLDIHPHPIDWLHIENSFSYVRGIQRNQPEDKKNLPFIPAPHYRGGVKVEFNNLGNNISNFYVKLNVDSYFAQNKVYSAYGTETPTPGYTLLSAGLGGSLNIFNKKDFLSFYLSAENLGNVAYQNHLSRLKYAEENPLTGRMGVFDMGRNVSLKFVFSI